MSILPWLNVSDVEFPEPSNLAAQIPSKFWKVVFPLIAFAISSPEGAPEGRGETQDRKPVVDDDGADVDLLDEPLVVIAEPEETVSVKMYVVGMAVGAPDIRESSKLCWAPKYSVEDGASWSMIEADDKVAELETVVVEAVTEQAVTLAHVVAQLEVVDPEIVEIAQDAVQWGTVETLHDELDVLLAVEDAEFGVDVGSFSGSSGKSVANGNRERNSQGGIKSVGGTIPGIIGTTRWQAASRTPSTTSAAR
jgi:hypothetical protein